MAFNVAINGFGRIGRQVFKAVIQGGFDDLFQVTAINVTRDVETVAHLLKYDSTYGHFDAEITTNDEGLVVNGKKIRVVSDRDPENLPWEELGIDVVIESTGAFNDANKARAHINAGANKVILTAPGTNEDLTLVLGVNEHSYDPANHHIISNASCTTNCLAPTAKVLLDNFGIQHGFMTTVHAYTADQVLQDNSHKDLRRARGAPQNIVPTTTGAARSVG